MTVRPLRQLEFVLMIAAVISTTAFSIDTMLPALPAIGAELSPDDPNRAQYVLTAFIIGLGVGTLFVGPVSDMLGRKPVLIATSALAILGALVSHITPSMEVLIAARVLHGVGASGPRALSLAIVRDLFEGRRMAQIMSLVMTVFSLIPAVAPLSGQFIEAAWGWRAIFLGFALWIFVSIAWLALRQPETLAPDRRTRIALAPIVEGLRQIAGNRVVVAAIVALSLNFGILFAMLVSVQPIFEFTFGRAKEFPLWFALAAVISMSSAVLNASVVIRLGMRVIAASAFAGQAALAGGMAITTFLDLWPGALLFPAVFVWITTVFWMMGLTIGNLNSLALEPMGRHAGLAASVISAVSTTVSALLAIPVGLAFDGTPLPAMVGVCAFSALALAAMWFTYGPKPGVERPR